MFTQEQIRDRSKRRAWVLMPAILLSVAALLLYFLIVGLFVHPFAAFVSGHFGEGNWALALVLFFLPAFAILLGPMMIAERYVRRFNIACPSCGRDVTRATERVLKTRCCPACERQIVAGGRVRASRIYKRYVGYRMRVWLKCWFWAWPLLGALVLGWWLVDRSAFQECPNALWTPSLLGTVAAGWAWLRTLDRRYLPQFLVSMALFALGAIVFWQS